MPDCPICKGFDEKDHFKCPECGRDYICGTHYDEDELVCSDCAAKHKGEVKEVKKPPAEMKSVKVEAEEPEEGPPSDKTPFFIKDSACPLCGAVSQNRFFKVKIYSERKVDNDKHVKLFGWSDPDFKFYHPPFYLFWHCSSCFYTAERVDFEKPGKDYWSNFRLLKTAFQGKLQEDRASEKLVSWLAKDVDFDKMNYPMAFNLHLLAIFIQQIVDKEEWDSLKLGRYYLRAGWLLRELKEKKTEAEKEKKAKQLAKLTKELEIINNISTEIKKIWKDLPATETEYLQKAAEFLSIAYESHQAIKNPAAATDILLWIAGIYLKMGDKDKGLNYLNNVIQSGQKQKIKIEARLKTPDLSPEDDKSLSMQVKKIMMSVAKARDQMQEIQYEKFKAQKEQAKKIVAKLEGREPEEIREALRKKGYSLKVMDALVPEKKKKRFGIF